ncbi:MAG: NAD(P)H-dependent oxidoreductase [Spirochaetota bacterium]|nr:NAD(P)H-dependent oxidoreductase [Spirochaetota bacterium]
MFVLGLQGSPRKNGNTSSLLSVFMKESKRLGTITDTVEVSEKNILPCKGCHACEKSGVCVNIDDFTNEITYLLWKADLIVSASPIFFYSVTAQLKALIDRSQVMWARKYKLNLEDPGRKWRKGLLIALGATKGKNLFEGVNLTAKYFYDAVGTEFTDSLTYRQIEDPGDVEKHPSAIKETMEKANELIRPVLNRKKVLFVCGENACRSQMAEAFTQYYAGDKLQIISAGNRPAEKVNNLMKEVMSEKGIDMYFRKPKSIDDAIHGTDPDMVFTMGCEVSCPVFPGAVVEDWGLADPAGESIDFMRNVRDDIEQRVLKLIDRL